jgi:DHA1 family tetracycline resistance protein-like MFS transporter
VTTPETRARGMGLVGAAIGVGFTMGPAIGGGLAGADPAHLSVAAPALAAAAMSALALLLALVALPESLPPSRRRTGARPGRVALIRDAFSRPRLRPLLVLFFTATLAFAAMESTFGQWAYARFAWGPRQVGEVLGTVGVMMIVIQGGLIGRLAARFGEARLLFAGTLMVGLGLAAMAVVSAPQLGVAACCLLALGQGLVSPSISSLVSRAAGGHEQGGILGVNQSMGSAARFVGPALAGAGFELAGPGAPYALGAGIMAVAAALAWHVLQDRRQPGAADRVPASPVSGSAR